LYEQVQLEIQEQRRLAEEDRVRHIDGVNQMIQQWETTLKERDTQLSKVCKELEVTCGTV
jgi:hypothetical protein